MVMSAMMRSPKLAGGLQAAGPKPQRLSPGVYRSAEGELVTSKGQPLPQSSPTAATPPAGQMQRQAEMEQSMMAQRPTPTAMPQMPQAPQFGQMMPQPGFNPFMNFMAQQPKDVQAQFAQKLQQPQPMMRPAVMPTYNFNPMQFTPGLGLPNQNK